MDIIPVPSPMDRIVLFAGLLECVEEDGLTRVHRRPEFLLARPLSWLLDPLMRRWLAKDVPAELARLKAHLEATTLKACSTLRRSPPTRRTWT